MRPKAYGDREGRSGIVPTLARRPGSAAVADSTPAGLKSRALSPGLPPKLPVVLLASVPHAPSSAPSRPACPFSTRAPTTQLLDKRASPCRSRLFDLPCVAIANSEPCRSVAAYDGTSTSLQCHPCTTRSCPLTEPPAGVQLADFEPSLTPSPETALVHYDAGREGTSVSGTGSMSGARELPDCAFSTGASRVLPGAVTRGRQRP